MWGWLYSWFFPDRRLIFTFWDGIRVRKADPLEVTRRLFDPAEEAKDFDIEETPQMLKCGVITQELEAFRLIGLAVRSAFDIPPVSQGGLTDMDCWVLLNSLCASNNGLKKWQPFSDLVGLNCGHLYGRIPHEQWFGLWLNRDRAIVRAAYVASGGDCLKFREATFLAMSDNAEKGKLAWWRFRGEMESRR